MRQESYGKYCNEIIKLVYIYTYLYTISLRSRLPDIQIFIYSLYQLSALSQGLQNSDSIAFAKYLVGSI